MTLDSTNGASGNQPLDRLGRPIRDLRISVIDRCNFRCTFCMPADREYKFLPRQQLMTFEEIERLVRLFVQLGVRKLRLTGGEPLLRRDIEELVRILAAVPGVEDLALTTNGALLGAKARALADAGLNRVTVSVESLRADVFGRVTGLGHSVDQVLDGIDAAAAAGLGPIKINTVVMKGTNEDEIADIAGYFKERGHIVRFIEFMDVGTVNDWSLDRVVTASEITGRIAERWPLEPVDRVQASDVAERLRYLDDGTEFGVISSISRPFCGDCARARLSSDGRLYTCLFADTGPSLRDRLRAGATDDELLAFLAGHWRQREDRYSEIRAERLRAGLQPAAERVEMFRIGG
ncbi:MAG: GTP 3',8-cyclase MoaA [Acidobacteria bacterium]|nr:GTP 3',8-cyclase MoaA [Acidobacteriota bacterium]